MSTRFWKSIVAALILLVAMVALTGCNAISGVFTDLASGMDALSRLTVDAHNGAERAFRVPDHERQAKQNTGLLAKRR